MLVCEGRWTDVDVSAGAMDRPCVVLASSWRLHARPGKGWSISSPCAMRARTTIAGKPRCKVVVQSLPFHNVRSSMVSSTAAAWPLITSQREAWEGVRVTAWYLGCCCAHCIYVCECAVVLSRLKSACLHAGQSVRSARWQCAASEQLYMILEGPAATRVWVPRDPSYASQRTGNLLTTLIRKHSMLNGNLYVS